MGKGDRKNRKSIGVDLAPTPRKKTRGANRQRELDGKMFSSQEGCACIYAIEARRTPFLKIGVARNPYNRLRDLQTGSPNELALLYAVETDERKAYEVEKLIHSSPEALNARGRGEWLDISPKIIPALFAWSADVVGADLLWRFGDPLDEVPDGSERWCDPIAKMQAGFSVARSRRKA
jgi:hypothetical protein